MDDYPIIEDGAAWRVELILMKMKEDPEFLLDPECPYTEDDRQALARMVDAMPVGDEDIEFEDFEFDEDGNKWDRLESQTQKLFKSLLKEQNNLNVKDNSEKMSFFRTATSLLDKLVGIQERAANLKQIHLFHDTVMRIMEDNLDAGQRTAVMDQLRQSIKPEAKK